MKQFLAFIVFSLSFSVFANPSDDCKNAIIRGLIDQRTGSMQREFVLKNANLACENISEADKNKPLYCTNYLFKNKKLNKVEALAQCIKRYAGKWPQYK